MKTHRTKVLPGLAALTVWIAFAVGCNKETPSEPKTSQAPPAAPSSASVESTVAPSDTPAPTPAPAPTPTPIPHPTPAPAPGAKAESAAPHAVRTNVTVDFDADGKAGSGPEAGANLLATGDWSKPVTDNHGNALRGRLTVYEGKDITVSGEPWRFATAVYLEIKDVKEANKLPTQIYFDADKTLEFELRDASGALVPNSLPGGAAANSPTNAGGFWATVPVGGVLRLHANSGLAGSVSLLGRPGTLDLLFHYGGQWIIHAGNSNVYSLSGIVPAAPTTPDARQSNPWGGSLEFPTVRISAAKR